MKNPTIKELNRLTRRDSEVGPRFVPAGGLRGLTGGFWNRWTPKKSLLSNPGTHSLMPGTNSARRTTKKPTATGTPSSKGKSRTDAAYRAVSTNRTVFTIRNNAAVTTGG